MADLPKPVSTYRPVPFGGAETHALSENPKVPKVPSSLRPAFAPKPDEGSKKADHSKYVSATHHNRPDTTRPGSARPADSSDERGEENHGEKIGSVKLQSQKPAASQNGKTAAPVAHPLSSNHILDMEKQMEATMLEHNKNMLQSHLGGEKKAYDGRKGKALGLGAHGKSLDNDVHSLISGVFRMGITATRLVQKDLFDITDGFVVISMENDHRDGWDYVYRSEVVMDCNSPDWALFDIDSFTLCKNEADRRVRFEVFDWDADMQLNLLGACSVPCVELLNGLKREFGLKHPSVVPTHRRPNQGVLSFRELVFMSHKGYKPLPSNAYASWPRSGTFAKRSNDGTTYFEVPSETQDALGRPRAKWRPYMDENWRPRTHQEPTRLYRRGDSENVFGKGFEYGAAATVSLKTEMAQNRYEHDRIRERLARGIAREAKRAKWGAPRSPGDSTASTRSSQGSALSHVSGTSFASGVSVGHKDGGRVQGSRGRVARRSTIGRAAKRRAESAKQVKRFDVEGKGPLPQDFEPVNVSRSAWIANREREERLKAEALAKSRRKKRPAWLDDPAERRRYNVRNDYKFDPNRDANVLEDSDSWEVIKKRADVILRNTDGDKGKGKDKGKDTDHSDKSEGRPKPHRKAEADPLYANYSVRRKEELAKRHQEWKTAKPNQKSQFLAHSAQRESSSEEERTDPVGTRRPGDARRPAAKYKGNTQAALKGKEKEEESDAVTRAKKKLEERNVLKYRPESDDGSEAEREADRKIERMRHQNVEKNQRKGDAGSTKKDHGKRPALKRTNSGPSSTGGKSQASSSATETDRKKKKKEKKLDVFKVKRK